MSYRSAMVKSVQLTAFLFTLENYSMVYAEDEVLDDPTRPAQEVSASVATVATPVPTPSWIVSGVKLDGANSSAIINGQVIHVNEKIEGATLAGVRATYVVLDVNGKRIRRELSATWVPQTRAQGSVSASQ